MLKKGQPVKFTRPMSTMRVVLLAVEQGFQYLHKIKHEIDLLIEMELKYSNVAE